LQAAGTTDFSSEVADVQANIASLRTLGTAVTAASASVGASDTSLEGALPPAAQKPA
jgi:hypothetical protein